VRRRLNTVGDADDEFVGSVEVVSSGGFSYPASSSALGFSAVMTVVVEVSVGSTKAKVM
jgi:hypothetical protein